MLSPSHIAWSQMEAERAFGQATRARRRAAVARRLRRECVECAQLAVHDELLLRPTVARRGLQEIPLDAITGTLEPNRAGDFDRDFRPSKVTRARWLRVFLAAHRGTTLPPVSVVAVGDGYALRDGHHRVSVARARGALSITAVVA
jgi:hypothetical protein